MNLVLTTTGRSGLDSGRPWYRTAPLRCTETAPNRTEAVCAMQLALPWQVETKYVGEAILRPSRFSSKLLETVVHCTEIPFVAIELDVTAS